MKPTEFCLIHDQKKNSHANIFHSIWKKFLSVGLKLIEIFLAGWLAGIDDVLMQNIFVATKKSNLSRETFPSASSRGTRPQQGTLIWDFFSNWKEYDRDDSFSVELYGTPFG